MVCSSGECLVCIPPLFGLVLKLGKKLLKKKQIEGIVIPRFSGKSHFVNNVCSNDFLLLDLEENVKLIMTNEEKETLRSLQGNPSYDLHYKPICKKYFQKIKLEHKNKPILIFSSSIDLLKYCGVSKIHSFIPSSKLCDHLKNKGMSDENIKLFESCRLELLSKLKPKQLHTYDSFDNLHQQLCSKFNLIAKL